MSPVFYRWQKRHPFTSVESSQYVWANKGMQRMLQMTFAVKVLLDLSTSFTSLPLTNDASTQTDLSCTDIDCLVTECSKVKEWELRLSDVINKTQLTVIMSVQSHMKICTSKFTPHSAAILPLANTWQRKV